MKKKLWGNFSSYMQWPFFLTLIAVLGTVAIFPVDRIAGFIALGISAVLLAASCFCYIFYRKRIMRELVSFGAEYAQVQKELLREMSVPYALIERNSRLLWKNYAFTELLGEEVRPGVHLLSLFPEMTEAAFPNGDSPTNLHLTLGNRKIRAEIRRVFLAGAVEELFSEQSAASSLYALYLFDETEMISYQKQLQDQRPVVGLIYLDNYDEALESIEEVRRSLLIALIDRKINKYVASMGGILKKLEKDKYLVILFQKSLQKMQDQKFPLLEEVKTVNIGNEMSVTISIGLGISGDSYNQNYQFARTAIDMALARGGDQVVLKNRQTITYYGGKTQTMEKNTRVKARVKAQALRELLEGKEKVLIMGHKISDVDSVGSAIGIYRAAKYSGKRAHIVLNTITASIKPLIDRFNDSPDYEEDLFINSERALELIDSNTVLVVVDVNRPSYTECPELLTKTPHIVVLDHHRQTREFVENAVLSYVEPYASSASEMVAEILQYYGDHVRLKALDADAIYSGIVIDTNNFLNKTGIRTFEAAAFLRRNGADMVRVRKLFRDNMDDYMAKAEAVSNAELFEKYYAISHCGNSSTESPTVIAAQAANELLSIRGVKASFVLSKLDNKIYISARSIDEVNVQVIMERLGGGGHMTIAGAQIPDSTIEDATALLKEIIHQMIDNKEI